MVPEPKFRSRSFKRRKIRTPGDRTTVHYRRGKVEKASCVVCGKVLHGVPRERGSGLKRGSKSRKTVNRPYGGNLCPACLKEALIERIRET